MEQQPTQDQESSGRRYDPMFVSSMIESSLRIALLFLLLFGVVDILRPFLVPLIWGMIIAMAAFPVVKWLQPKVGNRRGLAASLVTLVFILALVVPTWWVTDATVGALKSLGAAAESGELRVPPPPAAVADWPIVGERLFSTWSSANQNLEAVLAQAAPEIRNAVSALFKKVGGSLLGVALFVVSLLIAGGFMTFAEQTGRFAEKFFVRIGGVKPGGEWAGLTVAPVRSVLQGVVGVAVIQSSLVAIGLVVAGIPGAAIWSLVVLFLAIAQLPPLLVIVPMIFYAFNNFDTTTAVIFTVWQLLAGASDNILKPMLMGRGLDIPMPVIMFGAIGCMISAGINGLFAGAVILSIAYKLLNSRLDQPPPP